MGWVILIIWIIGTVTAYPRHKKWVIENIESDYDNSQMLLGLFACICMWYFVWAWFLFEKIGDLDWMHKKSKF